MSITDRSIEVEGASVHVRTTDGPERAVVLIHGNSASAATWTTLLEGPLGCAHRLIAIDLPGHGRSAPATDPANYSMPGYSATVASIIDELDADDAVLVGWSLGGHIAIETMPLLPEASGILVFGTPPLGMPPDMERAFCPNPAMGVGFTPDVDREGATAYATAFLAPGSTIDLEPFIADILATDGQARSALAASIGAGRGRDELEIVRTLDQPIAIVHGAREQLISGDYLATVDAPTLWRGEVQVIAEAGHAPHVETPDVFAALVADFVAELDR